MGRGISEQQKQILGVAYHANRITQGMPKLKGGAPVPNYRVPTVDYPGGKDMLWPLAAHIVRGLPFTEYGQGKRDKFGALREMGGYFDLSSKEVKAVKVSTIRAISALFKRDLLRLAPCEAFGSGCSSCPRWGYVLTREGFDIGAQHEIEFEPMIYVRAGMVWFPQDTTNCHFWQCFDHVKGCAMPLPDILSGAHDIYQQHGQYDSRYRNSYQGGGAHTLITLNSMETPK